MADPLQEETAREETVASFERPDNSTPAHVHEPRRVIPDDIWRARFEESRARLAQTVEGLDDSDDIEAEIGLSQAEVCAEHANRRSSLNA